MKLRKRIKLEREKAANRSPGARMTSEVDPRIPGKFERGYIHKALVDCSNCKGAGRLHGLWCYACEGAGRRWVGCGGEAEKDGYFYIGNCFSCGTVSTRELRKG